MNPVDYGQLVRLAWPEIIVATTALVVVAVDLMLGGRGRKARWAIAVALGCAGCTGAVVRLLVTHEQANMIEGTLIADPLTHLVQIVVLVLTLFTLLISVDSSFTEHIGEFVLLVLLATVGMMFLVATQDLLVIFISLELLSLSLYALTGFDKRSPQSSEAALKYFLFGGMSAAFLLYGFSLLYGLANSTSLPVIAAAIHGPPLNPLLAIAMVTTVIGFGFKIAAAPFHFWAPDAYQGAPAPSAAFIASGSKLASFFAFFQIMTVGFAAASGSIAPAHFVRGWVPVLVVVAILSMLLGNLVAIVQTSLRRLLAYSAVAHSGYMVLAIASHTQQSLRALLYYSITYGLAALGAFGVLAALQDQVGDAISELDGLSRRAPFLSLCFAIFVLSLAGIPPLAGFFAKFYLFVAVLVALPGSMVAVWLVILALAMSAVSLYYYLRVLKRIYVIDAPPDANEIQVPIFRKLVLGILAGLVVLVGCAPGSLLDWIFAAIRTASL